jgi:GT2 family glycosyltransferase
VVNRGSPVAHASGERDRRPVALHACSQRISTDRPPESVSVVVCTRDRPDQLGPALAGILASRFRDFELVVVDQSRGPESAAVVAAVAAADNRVHLVRDPGKGLSRARELGVASTSGDLIVFTDDDCVPDVQWLGLIVQTLRADPTAGIVFGTVAPAPCDPAEGFIVGYRPPRRRRLTGRWAKCLDGGIGANMALRRRALVAVGGFDLMLGAGGYFPSCEDGDIAYRVLRGGYAMWHVPEAVVLHYGLRDWASGGALVRDTFMAVAAAYMKHARRGDFMGGVLVLLQIAEAVAAVTRGLLRLQRPFGFGRLRAIGVGIVRSFELPIDPEDVVYRPR